MKYDVCLTMPLYYHTEIEAKSEKELWDKIDDLKQDYTTLFKDLDISKSNWFMSDDNDIKPISVTDENGENIL